MLTLNVIKYYYSGVCRESGEEGSCLAQVTVPASWWPPLAGADTGKKVPRIVTRVYYSVSSVVSGVECSVTSAREARVHVSPQHVAEVDLVSGQSGYQQVSGDEILHMLIPQTSLYPGSRVYVPVFVEQSGQSPVSVIVIKCRARRGVRIQGVEETSRDWTLRVELNQRGSVATVTAVRKDVDEKLNSDEGREYPG